VVVYCRYYFHLTTVFQVNLNQVELLRSPLSPPAAVPEEKLWELVTWILRAGYASAD